jgi:arylsulfatase A-like enzyme/nitrogen fixation protein
MHEKFRYQYLLGTLIVAILSCSQNLSAEGPNVLLILTDNQGYHELGCHGHEVVKTPHIDRLASQSIDFTNFHAPSFCSPSRALLMTGRRPLRYGVHNTIGGVSILHKEEKTLANYLKEAGYLTAIFGKWHLGMSYPYAARYRGFDECFVHGGGGIGQLEDAYGNKHINARYWHNGNLQEASNGYSTDILFGRAMSFIDEHVKSKPKKPFFCFISTPATHGPYQAHPEVETRLKKRGVNENVELSSMIENIDDNVGRILQQIDDLGLRNNTLVILTSDQGQRSRGAPKNSAEHPPSLPSDEKSQVFYMLRYPPLIKNPRSTDVLTGMVDVFPTVLDLCGLPLPENIDGRSQRPILNGAERWEDDRIMIFQCPRNRNRTKWKNVGLKTQNFRMTDNRKLLTADREQKIVTDHPEQSKRMITAYESYWNSLPPEADLLSRHLLGGEPTRLCAMDCYKGHGPWKSKDLEQKKSTGTWAVEVIKAGTYRFELRHYPREADLPIKAVEAELKVGETTANKKISENYTAAILEVDLQPGQYDMEGLFISSENRRWGSYFAYISLLEK